MLEEVGPVVVICQRRDITISAANEETDAVAHGLDNYGRLYFTRIIQE